MFSPFLIYLLNFGFSTASISPLVSTSTSLAQLLQKKTKTKNKQPKTKKTNNIRTYSFLPGTIWRHFSPLKCLRLQPAFTPASRSGFGSQTRDAHAITPQQLSARPPPQAQHRQAAGPSHSTPPQFGTSLLV